MLRAGLTFVLDEDTRQATEGRVPKGATPGDLLLVKGLVILGGGRLDGVVLRLVGLQDGASAGQAPSGATGRLGQQLEAALAGAKVRQVETMVGVDHAGQRNQRQVEAPGDHLRAHQHISRGGR